MTARRIVALTLWLAVTAAILFVTLGPVRQRLVGSEAAFGVLTPSVWFEASTWTQGRAFEFALNLAMFVPWGALAVLALGLRRWWMAALLGIALAVTIEVLQIPSPRISDPRDLVANTLGAVLGITLAAVALAPRALARRRASRLRVAG